MYRKILSPILEILGAAAITIGASIAAGPAAAWIVGGVLTGIFGFALDGPIRRPRQ